MLNCINWKLIGTLDSESKGAVSGESARRYLSEPHTQSRIIEQLVAILTAELERVV